MNEHLRFFMWMIFTSLITLMIYIFICQPPKTVLTFSSTESSVDTTQTVTDGEIKQTITTRIYGVEYQQYESGAEIYNFNYRMKYWTDNAYHKTLTPIDSIVQIRCYKEKECGE